MNANRNLQDFLTEFRRQNPASLGIPINDREAYHQALRLLPRAVKLRALVEEHAASLQAASDGELEGMLAGYANGGGLQDMTKGYVYFDDGLVANVRRALLRDILQAMPEAQRMPFLAAAYRRGNLAVDAILHRRLVTGLTLANQRGKLPRDVLREIADRAGLPPERRGRFA